MFEELGDGFTLLAFGADETQTRAFELAAESAGVPLKVIRDTWGDDREAYAQRLILVRPDQFVAWTGGAAPADAQAVLRRATGSR